MAEHTWKTVAKKCGRTLNQGVLNVLITMDLNNLLSLEAFRMKNHIFSVLPATMEVSERMSLAWDLGGMG